MSQSFKGFVVTLDQEVSEEYIDFLKNAISALKHVSSVDPVPTDFNDHIVEMRVRRESAQKVRELAMEILTGKKKD
jgi:hypothetical protein